MAAIQSSIITDGRLAATKLDSTGTAPFITTEVWLDSAALEFRPLGWGFPDLVEWVPGHMGCSWKGCLWRHFSFWETGSTVRGCLWAGHEIWMSGW